VLSDLFVVRFRCSRATSPTMRATAHVQAGTTGRSCPFRRRQRLPSGGGADPELRANSCRSPRSATACVSIPLLVMPSAIALSSSPRSSSETNGAIPSFEKAPSRRVFSSWLSVPCVSVHGAPCSLKGLPQRGHRIDPPRESEAERGIEIDLVTRADHRQGDRPIGDVRWNTFSRPGATWPSSS